MHGRPRIKTTAEKEAEYKAKLESKAAQLKRGVEVALAKRSKGELDDEALELTGQLVASCPDYAVLWNFRREILLQFKERFYAGGGEEVGHKQFQELCFKELELTRVGIMKNLKSYNAWHHRLWVIDRMPNPDLQREIELISKLLEHDERNFHAWDYRRIICAKANVDILKELEFTMSKIQTNFSNFSAWHYRSSLFNEADQRKLLSFTDKWTEEYSLVENAIFTDPTDQSAWFYHKWLSSNDFGSQMQPIRPDEQVDTVKFVIDRENELVFAKLNRIAKLWNDEWVQFRDSKGDQINTLFNPIRGNSFGAKFWHTRLPAQTEAIQIQSDLVKLTAHSSTATIVWSKEQRSKEQFKVSEKNLSDLQCLLEMEPDNKWVNRALSTFTQDQQELALDKLIVIDSLRKNYYLDQKTKLTIQKRIDVNGVQSFIDLSSLSLTFLYHVDRLAHVRYLNLSDNRISCISGNFNGLLCVETLILDNNAISSVDKNLKLLLLKTISLINNGIHSLDVLSNLANCERLELIYLHANPIADAAEPGTFAKLDYASSICPASMPTNQVSLAN